MTSNNKDYRAVFLVERDISAANEEQAEQLARKLGHASFEDDAANKQYDYVGSMVEEKE